MQLQTIVHTIPPLYDSESRVLLLGSIPSPKSREVGFFYGHPQNRFWRVLAAVLGDEMPVSIEDKRAMCLRHHVALWDTIAKCDIAGASDTSIRNAEPNDIGKLLRESKITRIFATGGKSAQLYRKLIEPKTGVPVMQLPSTSPANAAWSLERLIEAAALFFDSRCIFYSKSYFQMPHSKAGCRSLSSRCSPSRSVWPTR
ncbi:MAG: DNA-deoxyinosine glycosylase [Butyricicoccus sp.]